MNSCLFERSDWMSLASDLIIPSALDRVMLLLHFLILWEISFLEHGFRPAAVSLNKALLGLRGSGASIGRVIKLNAIQQLFSEIVVQPQLHTVNRIWDYIVQSDVNDDANGTHEKNNDKKDAKCFLVEAGFSSDLNIKHERCEKE